MTITSEEGGQCSSYVRFAPTNASRPRPNSLSRPDSITRPDSMATSESPISFGSVDFVDRSISVSFNVENEVVHLSTQTPRVFHGKLIRQ